METKTSIRKRILLTRSALSLSMQKEKSEQIAHFLITKKLLDQADFILSYKSFRGEVNTDAIFQFASMRQIPVFYPCVQGNSMEFYEIQNFTELKEGYQKILEPDLSLPLLSFSRYFADHVHEKGIVLVPGSVFDRQGVRFGYGGGFYDRFLAKHAQLQTIGLCYALQLQEHLKKETHDVLMDMIVTEQEWIQIQKKF